MGRAATSASMKAPPPTPRGPISLAAKVLVVAATKALGVAMANPRPVAGAVADLAT